jgi:hypothetical protein
MKSVMAVVLFGMCACASSSKEVKNAPAGSPDDSVSEGSKSEPEQVTPEELEDVQKVFTKKQHAVTQCYSDAVNGGKLDKKAAGRLTISVMIDTDGVVHDAKVTDDQLKSDDVEACVLKVMTTCHVPKPNVKFPFSTSYSFMGQ